MALKAGPKVRADLKQLPPAQEPVQWLESVTGELYPWQRDLVEKLSCPERPPRSYYAQIARKNGKSRAAACLASQRSASSSNATSTPYLIRCGAWTVS